MADMTEAADAVVLAIAGLAYPSGTTQASVGNCPIMVYQGWPDPNSLSDDARAGKVHVSVFPRPGGKVTTVMLGDTEWAEIDNNGTAGTGVLEVRRQARTLQITIWAGTPKLRDLVAKRLDAGLARITRLDLDDGSQAVLTSIDEIQIDAQQKSGVYRRDLLYSINYATTYSEPQTTVAHPVLTLTAGPTLTATGPTITRP